MKATADKYISGQLDQVSNYDPQKFTHKIKIVCSLENYPNGNGTNWMNITPEQFEKIRSIFK